MNPLRIQANLEEKYANLPPLSADKTFNHYNYRKERVSIATPFAEKSAPSFRKLT